MTTSKPETHYYLFDLKLTAAIGLHATSEAEALEQLKQQLDCTDAVFNHGKLTGEVSLNADDLTQTRLAMVDEVDVPADPITPATCVYGSCKRRNHGVAPALVCDAATGYWFCPICKASYGRQAQDTVTAFQVPDAP